MFPKDNPVYLFYGRPAYKSLDTTPSNDPADHKMVFVLKNYRRNSEDIIRVFPFDSGAYMGERFKDFIDPCLYSLDHFVMSTDICELPKHVCFFWGGNLPYLRDRKPMSRCFSKISSEMGVLANLLNARGRQPFDDRRSAVEVQSEKINSLLDCLYAVFVSDEFYNEHFDDYIWEELRKKDVTVIPYYTHGLAHTSSNVSLIYEDLINYYREELEVL